MRSWRTASEDFGAIALMSVLAKWHGLHVGAERSINCDHMYGVIDEYSTAALGVAGTSTRCLGSGFFQYQTACVASLDVKAAFDVANPSVMCKI